MTVKVRQLVRVSSGRVPPVPPPVVTMEFVQQPTDTETGDLFTPTITVNISDGSNDSLTISLNSGLCGLTPLTVTAEAGLAVFSGLRAGNIGMGCTLRVHNNSNAQVEDIISLPFNVTVQPPPAIEIVNNGTAIGAGQSANGSTLAVSTQINGEPLNTTGADFWIFFAATAFFDTDRRIRAWAFDDWQNYVFVMTFPDLFSSVCRLFSDYTIPQITGPDSGWSVREPDSPSSNPIDFSAPSSVSFALSGVNTGNPITAAASGNSLGPDNPGQFFVQLPSPMTVGRRDCFLVSCVVGVLYALVSAPYPNSFFLPLISDTAWGIGISWKFDSDLTENPVWSVNGQLDVSICAVAVTPA